MAAYLCDLLSALSSQSTIMGSSEHCSADPEKLAEIGRAVGDQVKIISPAGAKALFTVSESRQESPDRRIRSSLDGRKRLDTLGPTFGGGVCSSVCAATDLTDEEAEAQGELVERLSTHGVGQGLVVLAPHGGAIEAWTDEQAEAVFAALEAAEKPCASWRCKGWRSGGGAFSAWHITSTEIATSSFPLLATLGDGYPYGVAFHGFGEDTVAVGGAAPTSLLEEVAAAIESALGEDHPVEVVTTGEYAGTDPANLVNRLTITGGVQIEQPAIVRADHWLAVAEAVAAVFVAKL